MDLIVKDIKEISENYILINFIKPKKFQFEAGQWVDIELALHGFPVTNIFSIASSPSEADLLVLCKKGISKYKKLLENLKKGDKLMIANQGSQFTFNENNNCIFIAGGVGIAPFRGVIKHLLDNKIRKNITLIHLNAYEYFPFRDEFENWKDKFTNFKPSFVKTNGHKPLTMSRIQDLLHSTANFAESIFYVAGPSGLIVNCQTLFVRMGIEEELIKSEKFQSYLSNKHLNLGPVAQR